MAFFDELGKKISQTGQGVVQKTKDATETLKLNSMISDEEKRVNELYTEIGKKYFELHSETFETELENMINGIKQSQSRISAFSEQVKKLKGVVRCPNCGGEVAYNSQFCNLCGAAMNSPTAASTRQNANVNRYCPVCGAAVSQDKAFCTNCGNKMA